VTCSVTNLHLSHIQPCSHLQPSHDCPKPDALHPSSNPSTSNTQLSHNPHLLPPAPINESHTELPSNLPNSHPLPQIKHSHHELEPTSCVPLYLLQHQKKKAATSTRNTRHRHRCER